MKILAITDHLFTQDLVLLATAPAREARIPVEIRDWALPSLDTQRHQTIEVERRGPAAVAIPPALGGVLDHDILVVQFAPVAATVIERASKLRLILVNRSGLENVDVASATERGIAIVNTAGRNARAVAEFTVGLMLAELRNIARGHAALKAGSWLGEFPNGAWTPELHDRLIGFVGFGRIAELVARLLGGFDCRFQAYDPHRAELPAEVRAVDLETLMRTSDVISLHARLTPETHHVLGARELALAKPTAVLVNTARAGLVDSTALRQALRDGQLGGAALDVFDSEPVSPADSLIQNERTTVTPHLAGTTRDSFMEGPRMLSRALHQLLAGERPIESANGVPATI